MRTSVLFVCLGNICRSPLAEAAFRREAERLGLDVRVDSAGTAAWHVGKSPDHRSIAVAARNGIDISALRGRQVSRSDFYEFDHIVALDAENLANLAALAPTDASARLSLLLDHVPGREGQPVADPYYGDSTHFDLTWSEVTAGAEGLARKLAGGG
jgi:protein-tyrosine phosphatase